MSTHLSAMSDSGFPCTFSSMKTHVAVEAECFYSNMLCEAHGEAKETMSQKGDASPLLIERTKVAWKWPSYVQL